MTWDDLNQAGPCGHVFASDAYLNLVGETFRGHIDETTVEIDGRLGAATRVLVRRSPFATRAVVPGYTAYSAVLLETMPTEADTHGRTSALEKLLAELEGRYAGIDLNLPPEIMDVRTFSWRNWAVRPLYTYRIELSNETLTMRNWSDTAARTARKDAEGFEIVEVGPDIVAARSAASYDTSGRRAPLSKGALTKFIDKANQSVGASLVGARNRQTGDIDSAVALLRHGTVAYYWIAGGVRGSSMTVLLGKLFEDLAQDGIDTFDFVGANTDSIAEFKRKFGGRLTTYFRAVWRHGPVIGAEDVLHSLR